MTRETVQQRRAIALAACRLGVAAPTVPAQDETTDRVYRMARFAAGARRVVVRAVATGALVAAGWLLAVLFGMLTAAPAAADATAATGAVNAEAAQSLAGPDHVSASDNAEAMAGRTVDGLNSQQDPGLPTPSTAGKILDTNGLVPNGGGSGPFGPAAGDVARSVFDPRLQAGRAPLARLLPPVVRTAADDPSFSPD
ncbi:hypothetical protein SAMN05444920_104783 [Nonomuraea solani]|uniref:Uncharacterized protein n=1 Tax=Nonomuraea solani TaxID=1144553 RepID=A0A1H6D5S6_9ACTN|nr:hypothetical protein [Nonomuraea solani]SEG79996.1 hypothetical protein SAMN05444920_104783 [Nonomuraea solani]